MDFAISFKHRNESVYIFFTLPLASEIEIKGEEASGSFEESHDKDKCKLVIERMAYEAQLAALPC